MSKRKGFLIAGLLIGTAILIGVLKGLGYDLLDQGFASYIPSALFGGGISVIILSLFNKNKRIEENK